MSPPAETAWRAFMARKIGIAGVLMFGRYQLAASRSGLLPHSHRNAIEICFLERGEQTYRVGGFLYRLRGNDQFFTLPGEVHDTADLPQERGILYWLILKLEPSKKFLGLSERMASRLKRELLRMPTRHFRAHPESARILGEINDLLQGGKKRRGGLLPFHELRLQALLLQYLTRTLEASHQGVHGTASPLMQRLLRYIDDHLTEPVQVSLLAQAARLSESRCKARFKREIGVPPAEFWLRKKNRACHCAAQKPERDRGGLRAWLLVFAIFRHGLQALHNGESVAVSREKVTMPDVINFRALARSDFPLLQRWLSLPHVVVWWREPLDLAGLDAKYGPQIDGLEPTHVFMIEYDGQAIGWIQWYRWSDYAGHAAKLGAEAGSAGVDLALGEEEFLGRGLGSRVIREFVERMIFAQPDITAIYSDPEEKNVRSLRAFAKAGFEITKKGYFDGKEYRQCVVRRRRR